MTLFCDFIHPKLLFGNYPWLDIRWILLSASCRMLEHCSIGVLSHEIRKVLNFLVCQRGRIREVLEELFGCKDRRISFNTIQLKVEKRLDARSLRDMAGIVSGLIILGIVVRSSRSLERGQTSSQRRLV